MRILRTPFILAETSPAIPITISILATVFLFVLVRIAMDLYQSQGRDLVIVARRIADLDARVVRLDVTIENLKKQSKSLKDIQIAAFQGKVPLCLGRLEEAPIQRQGDPSFIARASEGYTLNISSNSKNEAIIEFHLSEARKNVYILATNQEGKRVRAYLNLDSSQVQLLTFRKF